MSPLFLPPLTTTKKAQEEIDCVIGTDKLPSWSDQDALPYTSAVIKEVMRLYPPASLSLLHVVTNEDVYEGFRIPARSIVYGNIWAILRDEDMYKEPLKFNPERFLTTRENGPEPDPLEYIFGFGRRICPGKAFAEGSMFIVLTSLLATFNLSKAIDERGREIEPEVAFNGDILSPPKPFQCRIQPRSENHIEVIRQAVVSHGRID